MITKITRKHTKAVKRLMEKWPKNVIPILRDQEAINRSFKLWTLGDQYECWGNFDGDELLALGTLFSIDNHSEIIYLSWNKDGDTQSLAPVLDKLLHFAKKQGYCRIGVNKSCKPLADFMTTTVMDGPTEVAAYLSLDLSDFQKLPPKGNYQIEGVTESNVDEYLSYHDKTYVDYYWNSKRIQSSYKDWFISFIRDENGAIIAALNALEMMNDDTLDIQGFSGKSEDAMIALIYDFIERKRTEEGSNNPQVFAIRVDCQDQIQLNALAAQGFKVEEIELLFEKNF